VQRRESEICLAVVRGGDTPAHRTGTVTSCRVLTRGVDATDNWTIATALRDAGSDTMHWLVRLPPALAHDDPALAPAIDRAVQQERTLAAC
jgi:hypothetical protein